MSFIPRIPSSSGQPPTTVLYSDHSMGGIAKLCEEVLFPGLETVATPLAAVGRVAVYSSQSENLLPSEKLDSSPPANTAPEEKIEEIEKFEIAAPAQSPFAQISAELLVEIFAYLPPSSLLQCKLVCKGFNEHASTSLRTYLSPLSTHLPWETETFNGADIVNKSFNYAITPAALQNPELLAKICSFLSLAGCKLRPDNWDYITDIAPSTDSTKRAVLLFEILTRLQKSGFPMHDKNWGILCDALVEEVRSRQGDLPFSLQKKIVLFLLDQGWTYQRQHRPEQRCLFTHFVYTLFQQITIAAPHFSSEESLKLLQALAKILSGSGSALNGRINGIYTHLILDVPIDFADMPIDALIELVPLRVNNVPVDPIGDTLLLRSDELTKEQILKFFSKNHNGESPHLREDMLQSFLERLQILEEQSNCEVSEVNALIKHISCYEKNLKGLPFFMAFYSREQAKLVQLTPQEIPSLSPQHIASWAVLCDHHQEKPPENWKGNLSLAQISGSLSKLPTESICRTYSERWAPEVINMLSSEELQTPSMMYDLLKHVKGAESFKAIAASIKLQMTRPEREFSAPQENGSYLKLMFLLYRHGLWDSFSEANQRIFAPFIEELKSVDSRMGFECLYNSEAPNETLRKIYQQTAESPVKALEFLRSMSWLSWGINNDNPQFAEISHFYLKELENAAARYVSPQHENHLKDLKELNKGYFKSDSSHNSFITLFGFSLGR